MAVRSYVGRKIPSPGRSLTAQHKASEFFSGWRIAQGLSSENAASEAASLKAIERLFRNAAGCLRSSEPAFGPFLSFFEAEDKPSFWRGNLEVRDQHRELGSLRLDHLREFAAVIPQHAAMRWPIGTTHSGMRENVAQTPKVASSAGNGHLRRVVQNGFLARVSPPERDSCRRPVTSGSPQAWVVGQGTLWATSWTAREQISNRLRRTIFLYDASMRVSMSDLSALYVQAVER